LLFASFILRSRGHKVIYLGTSTPIDDLNKIFKIHNPDVIFCAITNSNQMMPVQVYMNTLSRSFPNTDVLLTGNQVIKRRDLKVPSNVRIIGSPDDFLVYLDVDLAGISNSSKSNTQHSRTSLPNGNGSSTSAGYPNGNGSENGRSNGSRNGHSNGSSNGSSNGHSNGSKYGSSNGSSNGNSSGYTNGSNDNGNGNGYGNSGNNLGGTSNKSSNSDDNLPN